VVIDPTTLTGDRAQFGATVTIEDEDGKVSTYQIVGEDEVDAAAGRISHRSPVGKAVLGKQKGDSVMVLRPAGEIEITIKKIEFK
jgi:transcription elongation GreA/GreB family factor